MKCYIRQSNINLKPKKDMVKDKEARRKEMAKKFDTLIEYTDEEAYMKILIECLDTIDFKYVLMFESRNYVPVLKTHILKLLPKKIEYMTMEPYIGIRKNEPSPHCRAIPTSVALSKIDMIDYLTNRYGEKFIEDNNIKYPSDNESYIYEYASRPLKEVRDELFEYWMEGVTYNE